MNVLKSKIGWVNLLWSRWLFESCSPHTCVVLRIGYALLMVIYTLVWLRHGEMWFSDSGVMSAEAAQNVLQGEQQSLFFWVPASPALVRFGLFSMLGHAICMGLGFYSRVQAGFLFFWLTSFQHRNPLILDGEDTVFRLFAFFFIFLPLDYAFAIKREGDQASPHRKEQGLASAWALRLVQIEMCLIYLSAAWSKALGSTWQDGTALFYVYQMEDLFGRNPLPAYLTTTDWVIRWSTWSVVFVEAALPLALLFRPTRTFALFVGIGLHLTMEYTMHLHLFQWVMILGLLSFLPFRPLTSSAIKVATE